MNRSYTAHSPYSLSPTERIPSSGDDGGETVDLDRERHGEYDGLEAGLEEYGDIGEYEDYYEPIDRRWIWIAGVAGAILLVAVICTVVILGGGDSGSVSTTINPSAPPATTTQPAATTSAPPVATRSAPPPAATLPPETVTTVSPTAGAPTSDAPADAAQAPAPNTITYRVTGNRNLIDLVTVIYTDAQGALQTDVNVALPWAKTVVLDPGVALSSVTATSVAGQLNCSIADASGTAIAVQNNNTMIANCTK
jgi:Mycobacterium membrane protein